MDVLKLRPTHTGISLAKCFSVIARGIAPRVIWSYLFAAKLANSVNVLPVFI